MIGRRPKIPKPKPEKIIRKSRTARKPAAANAIVERYAKYAKGIANNMANSRELSQDVREELVSTAFEALVESSRTVKFADENELKGYLKKRIVGAIIDFLRKEATISRGAKRRSYLETKDPKLRASEDMAYKKALSKKYPGISRELPPEEKAVISDALVKIKASIGRKRNGKRWLGIMQMIAEGLTSKEIADRLGLKESRISQIMHQNIEPIIRIYGLQGNILELIGLSGKIGFSWE